MATMRVRLTSGATTPMMRNGAAGIRPDANRLSAPPDHIVSAETNK